MGGARESIPGIRRTLEPLQPSRAIENALSPSDHKIRPTNSRAGAWVTALPKTASGRIQRYALRQRVAAAMEAINASPRVASAPA